MAPAKHAAAASLALTLLMGACDDYPKDPKNTLQRVSGGTVRAGAIAAEPWVIWQPEGPAGVEVELVERLARTLDARVTWYRGTEHEVIDALKHRQLDIVVGGLTKSSPRSSVVGFTRPYLKTDVVIVGPSADAVADIEGRDVTAQPGTVIAAYVQSEGGNPVPETAEAAPALAARRSWRVDRGEALMRSLRTEQHVVAVPPGENAWLITVDRFFKDEADTARRRLRELGP